MRENLGLIGAGSATFTRGLVADILQSGLDCELRLVDIDPEALAVAEGLVKKMIEAKGAKIRLSASTDRRAVLKGASVVISTIGVGGRRAWETDVYIPRKFGIFQPVGDSVMPGGTSRALRMIPAMAEIAADVLDLAPEALFFNYANPMAAICRGARKATGAEIIGLCHGVQSIAHELEAILNLSRGSLAYTAVGMNHLTWFTEARADGRDVFPKLRAFVEHALARDLKKTELGEQFEERNRAEESEATPLNPFCWKLFLLCGAYPCPGDRHVTEFFPHLFRGEGSYFGKTLGVDAFPLERWTRHGDKVYAEMREAGLSSAPLPREYFDQISGEHSEALDILRSIRKDERRRFSANLPNRGQVPNLPEDAVVECPAVADASGLKAVLQPPLDPFIAGTLATRFQWAETVVDAALEGSREKFVQALILDGAVTSLDIAERLADALLSAQAEYLPRFHGSKAKKKGNG
ncbi:MAG: hypothetical protein V1918_01250 [Planctomycetota bacterium]